MSVCEDEVEFCSGEEQEVLKASAYRMDARCDPMQNQPNRAKVHSYLPRDNDRFASQPFTTLAHRDIPPTSRSLVVCIVDVSEDVVRLTGVSRLRFAVFVGSSLLSNSPKVVNNAMGLKHHPHSASHFSHLIPLQRFFPIYHLPEKITTY